jgi:hypothetical protein
MAVRQVLVCSLLQCLDPFDDTTSDKEYTSSMPTIEHVGYHSETKAKSINSGHIAK